MMIQDNYTYLTEAPIHRVIITMALPTIVSMLVTSLYNIADTFFVGQIDTQSTAAVGIVFSVMFFIQAFGFFFGHGSGNYISRELGAKRIENAERMASTGFFLSLFFGLVFLVIGELLLTQFCIWLGSTPTILPYSERYMGIILLGAPLLTSSLTLNNQMRLQGNARLAMYGIVTGALINVLLDPLFIFVFDMGVAGAAVATVIGQTVSFCILLHMTHRSQNISIRLRNFSPSRTALKEIFYGGSPSLSRQGLGCVATISLNVVAGRYGDAAIAAMSIVSRITMLVMSAVIGLGQGFQPLCGFCYGAKLYKRLWSAYRFTVKVGTMFLLVFSIICFLFSNDVIAVFRNEPDVIAIGTVALNWQLVTLPLLAVIVTSNMLTQTCRKPLRANILAAARQGLFFVPLILMLPFFFGLKGVEMCQAWSDACSFLITVPVMIYTYREFFPKR
ncbi:MATE efflux family protein [Prevotella sp. DNF00663]|uniref:MATE family efflux transporter n=1 Tax=unclassified Prevotella TaxID=2638335 RepID=UPI0005145ADE|nr:MULTISPECIES: MATE family efflux transporter [unclassified Prevotella]KGI59439.1 multidrug transporter MatE [Prevotella sp. S7 MS 2]KXB82410.1 MATE efflux family protein [Prevotella sp. DNF00663]